MEHYFTTKKKKKKMEHHFPSFGSPFTQTIFTGLVIDVSPISAPIASRESTLSVERLTPTLLTVSQPS